MAVVPPEGAPATGAAPDSAALAAFDALVSVRADAIASTVDSVRRTRHVPRPWSARWGWLLWVLAALALGAVAVAGGVSWLDKRYRRRSQRRRSEESSRKTSRPRKPSPPTETSSPAKSASAQEVGALRSRVLKLELYLIERTRGEVASEASASPPVSHPPIPPSPPEAVAAAFVEWCRSRGELVSQRELFAAEVAELAPGATVETVYRDLGSPDRPVRFDGKGGLSPTEYWLVQVGSERLVLPKPEEAKTFSDLAPVYTGRATPARLKQIVPAQVRDEGVDYVLTHPGRVV